MHDQPFTVGRFERIYDPSAGEPQKWYVNDHTIARDHTGLWHLIGITHEQIDIPPLEKFFNADRSISRRRGRDAAQGAARIRGAGETRGSTVVRRARGEAARARGRFVADDAAVAQATVRARGRSHGGGAVGAARDLARRPLLHVLRGRFAAARRQLPHAPRHVAGHAALDPAPAEPAVRRRLRGARSDGVARRRPLGDVLHRHRAARAAATTWWLTAPAPISRRGANAASRSSIPKTGHRRRTDGIAVRRATRRVLLPVPVDAPRLHSGLLRRYRSVPQPRSAALDAERSGRTLRRPRVAK